MLLSEIESWVRSFVRNGSDSSRYATDSIHRAVQSVGARFVSETSWIATGDLTLSAGTSALPSLAAAIALGFTSDRVRRARLVLALPQPNTAAFEDPRLTITDYGQVLNRLVNYPQVGAPQMIGFETYTNGAVWPTPDNAYTLRLSWLATFNNWTPGSPLLLPTLASGVLSSVTVSTHGLTSYGSTPSVTITDTAGTGATATCTLSGGFVSAINVTAGGSGYVAPRILLNGVDATDQTLLLPDDVMKDGILTDGARMVLQATEPENKALVALSQANFESFIVRMKSRGAGTLGAQLAIRSNPYTPRRRRMLTGWYRG